MQARRICWVAFALLNGAACRVPSVPSPPRSVHAAAMGLGKVEVTWDPPASDGAGPIISYTVTPDPAGPDISVVVVKETHAVLSLPDGIAFTFFVNATNAYGDGLPSARSNAVSVLTVPASPTRVIARAGVNSGVVSWVVPRDNGGSPIVSFTVTAKPGGATATIQGSSSRGAVVPGLDAGTSYTFTVVATTALGSSAPSKPSNAITPFTTPGAPTEVTAIVTTQNVTVSWVAPVADGGAPVTSYTVTPMSGGVAGTVTTVTGTQAQVTGMASGTEYTFAVVAVNVAGSSAPASSNSVTTPVLPGAPADVVATAGDLQASIVWAEPDNGGGPVVYSVIPNSPIGPLPPIASASPSITVTGLTDGTRYTFTVIATNLAGQSAPSAPSNAVVPVPMPSQNNSVLTATPAATSSGDLIALTVTVADASGIPLANQPVTLTSTGFGALDATTGHSDETGVFRATLTSGAAGQAQVTASIGSVTLAASARFSAAPVCPGGGIAFPSPATVLAGSAAVTLATADLNGDSHADLAVADEAGGISVLLGAGDGTFQPPIRTMIGGTPAGVASGDLNGDGTPDLAVAESNGLLMLFGAGDGTFPQSSLTSAPAPAVALAIADFNGDGFDDVAFASADAMTVLLSDGAGGSSTMTFAVTSPTSLIAGDFNGDGHQDLAYTAQSAVYLQLGDGRGGFGAAQMYPLAGPGVGLTAVSLGDDGATDIAAASSSPDEVTVLSSYSGMGFGQSQSFALDGAPLSVAATDFTGTGRQDIVVATTTGFDVLLSAGDGGLRAGMSYPVMLAPGLVTADFNEDGRQDVAVDPAAGGASVSLQSCSP